MESVFQRLPIARDSLSLGLIFSIIALVFLGFKITQSLILSPLRSIPGPWYAAVTSYYLILRDLAGQRTKTIHRLHEIYGAVVRIGPNEVSFSSGAVVKELYGQTSNYLKAPIYEAFLPGLFSLLDREKHRERRRYLSYVFSMNHLQNVEPVIQENVMLLLDGIASKGENSVNVMEWFKMFALDVTAELSFGKSFQAMQSGRLPEFVHDIDNVLLVRMLEYTFPPIGQILRMMPGTRMKRFLESKDRVTAYGEDSFKSYVTEYGRTPTRRDLLSRLISAKTAGEIDLTDIHLAEEASTFIFAGTDTTATTLVYLFWELSHRPEWQERIRAELKAMDPSSPESCPEWKTLPNLEVLDAVVKEALRLHTAAPASLWRVVPKGGRLLDGYFVVVSMQSYTTHRDPDVFLNPEEFDPSRWLPKEQVTASMNELFMPYSKGTRACIGINLANMELRIVTAALLKLYRVRPGVDMTSDDMEMTDHFLLVPKGGKCNLVFEKIKE